MFHLILQKDRNIPMLYEKVHDFLGHSVHVGMISASVVNTDWLKSTKWNPNTHPFQNIVQSTYFVTSYKAGR